MGLICHGDMKSSTILTFKCITDNFSLSLNLLGDSLGSLLLMLMTTRRSLKVLNSMLCGGGSVVTVLSCFWEKFMRSFMSVDCGDIM
eukprot:m.6609 g.6609  ORF g.6609 m.6609 type:complete len:87 (-) comp5377_c0_seq2:486-746(-)